MLVVGLGLGSGCAHRPSEEVGTSDPTERGNRVSDEERITEIARQAVAANDTWVDRAEFGPPKRETDGSWSVLVWRLPKAPGGHRVVLIDEEGKVTEYVRGR